MTDGGQWSWEPDKQADSAPRGPNTTPAVTGTARRSRGLVFGIVVIAVLALGVVATLVVSDMKRSDVPVAEAPDAEALQHWWADSHGDVEALRATIDDAQRGLAIQDDTAVASACQAMHDGELKLRARLPAPEPVLTSTLDGAIEDAHGAAHMCLAAVAGSLNNYAGEFRSDMEQAEQQLQTAQDLVNKLLTET